MGKINLYDFLNLSVVEKTHTYTLDTEEDLKGSGTNLIKGKNYLVNPDGKIYSTRTGSQEIAPPIDGLVALYHFNEGDGTTVGDSVGTNHGTITNMVWVTSSPLLGAAHAKFNGDGYVNAGAGSDFDATSAITIELWAKGNVAPTQDNVEGLVCKEGAYTICWDHTSGGLCFWVKVAGSWKSSGVYTAVSAGTWYHLAGVYDGSYIKMYVNGNKVSESAASGSITISDKSLLIGSESWNASPYNYFSGELDEVAIYKDVALPDEVILQHAKAGSPAKSSLIFLPYQDISTPAKVYSITPTKAVSSNTDIVILQRSGSTEAIDTVTDSLIDTCYHSEKTDWDGGITTNSEYANTKSFLNGVSPSWGASDWLNFINVKNDITGNDWTNYILSVDHGGAVTHVISPSVIREGDTYKMWCSSYEGNWKIAYFTSKDGKSWKKQGIVIDKNAVPLASAHAANPCVIKDGNTYKMWWQASDGSNYRIFYSTSNDGINWTHPFPNTPAININAVADASVHAASPTVIKDGSTYRMWWDAADATNTHIYYSTSTDGQNWEHNATPAIDHGAVADASKRASSPTVIKENGVFKMWWAAMDGNSWHIYYSTSDDGQNWSHPYPNTPAINHGEISYGSANVSFPCIIRDGYEYKLWWGAHDGSNWHIIYSEAVDSFSTSATYESPAINFGSSFLIDQIAFHTDIPTGTSISVQIRTAASEADLSTAVYNTAQNLGMVGNNKINAIKVSGITANVWAQYKLNFSTDGSATPKVKSVAMILQPTNWERCVDITATATNSQDLATNRYWQTIIFGVTDEKSGWSFDKIETFLKYGNVDLKHPDYTQRAWNLKKVSFETGYDIPAIDYSFVTDVGTAGDYENATFYPLTTGTSSYEASEQFQASHIRFNHIQTSIGSPAVEIWAKNSIASKYWKWCKAHTTLAAAVTTTDTSISLTDASEFANSGTIIIEGDEISYTGKSNNTLTGVSGIDANHAIGKDVFQEVAITGTGEDVKYSETIAELEDIANDQKETPYQDVGVKRYIYIPETDAFGNIGKDKANCRIVTAGNGADWLYMGLASDFASATDPATLKTTGLNIGNITKGSYTTIYLWTKVGASVGIQNVTFYLDFTCVE